MNCPTPYYESDGITLYCGDCRDILPTLPDASVTSVVSDPPYGVRKAEWDDKFHDYWLPEAARIAERSICIMPGITNLLRLPQTIGEFEYVWTVAVRYINGRCRGLIGFGNWLPAVLYGKPGESLYKCQQDSTEIAIRGERPNHPSPKPLAAMTWILSRLPDGSVCDPFCGSGTTLIAAKQAGRKAIGIEINEDYCCEVVKRLSQGCLGL
jgi:site-specific DNA-methyltransferase (adenine-specific)